MQLNCIQFKSIIDILEENIMSNTTVSKITISKDNATVLVNNIQNGLKTINKGYLAIAPDVQKLYDTHAFAAASHPAKSTIRIPFQS